MLKVTPDEFKALEAACDALIPSIDQGEAEKGVFYRAKASDQNVAQKMIDVVSTLRPAEQKEFKNLLRMLESRMAGLIFGGSLKRFRDFPLEKQQKILYKWMRNRFNLLRKAFQTLKKLSLFFHYGSSDDSGNPTWKAIGYPGPLDTPAAPPLPIEPWIAGKNREITADVIIVGSGAAGGLAAGMFAEAGKSVILIEKGPYMAGEDFTQREADMVRKTFDSQGGLATANGSTTIFAGNCLGGGTTVNWTGSFPTPDYVRGEWAKEHGLGFAESEAYLESSDQVMASLNVNSENSPDNGQNSKLRTGSEKMGQKVDVIARNVEGCQVDGCQSCGYCGMGCRRGAKRGTLRTWIKRAADAGAKILVDTAVQKIILERGKAAGVEAVQNGPNGEKWNLKIRAPRVIVAAGAIHTPAILMRSGLSHPHLGRHLCFHPTVAVSAYYNDVIAPWFGVMMSAVNKTGMKTDGNYGFWIETPPLHTGVAAMSFPWVSALQHKRDMLRIGRMATFIVLTRDKFGGHVGIDNAGNAVAHYNLHPYDRQNMLKGIGDAFRIHVAAGAEVVHFPHNKRMTYKVRDNKLGPENFLGFMPGWGWRANQFQLFSAHQMGTCALGDDPGRHPVQPDGQFRGIPGLYVIDGSVMPTSVGVNPMIPIMGMAHWLVKGML